MFNFLGKAGADPNSAAWAAYYAHYYQQQAPQPPAAPSAGPATTQTNGQGSISVIILKRKSFLWWRTGHNVGNSAEILHPPSFVWCRCCSSENVTLRHFDLGVEECLLGGMLILFCTPYMLCMHVCLCPDLSLFFLLCNLFFSACASFINKVFVFFPFSFK